jgi:hypothetical protein
VATVRVSSHLASDGSIYLAPASRVLTLRVPDAARLHSTDRRTHGVLLERLMLTDETGTTDLLATHPA